MRTKKVKIIFIIVLILLVVYFRNIIGALIIHSENIDKSALISMFNARLNPERIVVLKLENQSYSVPLPKGSARFENQQYKRFLTSEQFLSSTTFNDIDKYANTLSKYGWVNSVRLGDAVMLSNQDGKAVICITQNAFTHFYSRLSYSISPMK